MRTVQFFFATHNHQPVGNFDFVFEEAYQKSYKPFFDVAARHPSVRFGTHFTGALLDWLRINHPELIALLRELSESGRIELLTGGYFEPIMAVIPPWDQLSQISRLTNEIENLFGQRPSGMWLAERVWEQPLTSVLANAGVRYVLLDDTHFLAAGLSPADLNGYFLTEDQGKVLAVFPISKELRYTMPFASVDETVRVLHDAASEDGKNIIFFADDGEKFGVWPHTYHSVYEQGWLEEFFTKLEENKSWITTLHGNEVLNKVPAKGRIFIPNCSYSEMLEWALPTADAGAAYESLTQGLKESGRWESSQRFVRGGYWRNFFVKYPEANYLHKRVWDASARLEHLRSAGLISPTAHRQSENHLHAAESNDVYWHGVFGGIYLNNLRHAAWTQLLEGENILSQVEPNTHTTISRADVDRDGYAELILESDRLKLVLAGKGAAGMLEFDFKPSAFNVLNILNRRPEVYHGKLRTAMQAGEVTESKSIHDVMLTKEKGLEKDLIYDRYAHGGFLEHFLPLDMTVEEFAGGSTPKRIGAIYSHTELDAQPERATIHFEGRTVDPSEKLKLSIKKSISVSQGLGHAEVTYRVANDSDEEAHCIFASEWCANFLAGNVADRYYEADGKKLPTPRLIYKGAVTGAGEIRIVDEWMQLSFFVRNLAADFWVMPIETVSMSEAGFEKVYQGSIMLALWHIALAPGEVWETNLKVGFDALLDL